MCFCASYLCRLYSAGLRLGRCGTCACSFCTPLREAICWCIMRAEAWSSRRYLEKHGSTEASSGEDRAQRTASFAGTAQFREGVNDAAKLAQANVHIHAYLPESCAELPQIRGATDSTLGKSALSACSISKCRESLALLFTLVTARGRGGSTQNKACKLKSSKLRVLQPRGPFP